MLIDTDPNTNRERVTHPVTRTLIADPGTTPAAIADVVLNTVRKVWDQVLIDNFAEFVVQRMPEQGAIAAADLKRFARRVKRRQYKLIRHAEQYGLVITSISEGFGQSTNFTLLEPRRSYHITINEPRGGGNLRLRYCSHDEIRDETEPFLVNLYPLTIHDGGDWQVVVEKRTDGLVTLVCEGDRIIWVSKTYKTLNGALRYARKATQQQQRLRAPIEWIACVHPDDADVYAGRRERHTGRRQSVWANPYVVGKDGPLEDCLADFEEYLLSDRYLMSQLASLQGKRVGCFCCKRGDRLDIDDPLKCHVQVMARVLRQQSHASHL